jgi:cobalamin biosynthesis Co2+ chelatase CbiK
MILETSFDKLDMVMKERGLKVVVMVEVETLDKIGEVIKRVVGRRVKV